MTLNVAQPTEDADHILVAILDETYGDVSDEDWDVAREAFRQGLETEYGVPFTDADIGPGASFPAFATLIEAAIIPGTAAFALISAGKPIQAGVEGWLKLAGQIGEFFTRRVYVNRQGAAALAIEAVVKEAGGISRSIRFNGYQLQHVTDPEDLAAAGPFTEFAEAPDTLYLGAVRHLFEIDADGAVFRVSVEGQAVKTLRVAAPSEAAS